MRSTDRAADAVEQPRTADGRFDSKPPPALPDLVDVDFTRPADAKFAALDPAHLHGEVVCAPARKGCTLHGDLLDVRRDPHTCTADSPAVVAFLDADTASGRAITDIYRNGRAVSARRAKRMRPGLWRLRVGPSSGPLVEQFVEAAGLPHSVQVKLSGADGSWEAIWELGAPKPTARA